MNKDDIKTEIGTPEPIQTRGEQLAQDYIWVPFVIIACMVAFAIVAWLNGWHKGGGDNRGSF